MKPSEPRRNKNRNTAGPSANGASSGHVTGRKRKSPSPAPAAVVPDLNNPDGPLPEFACKVCGRLVAVDLFSFITGTCTWFLLASFSQLSEEALLPRTIKIKFPLTNKLKQ